MATDLLISAGGDDRLTVDEQSGLTKYGCSPRPTNVLSLASSTANTISAEAFAHAESLHRQLLRRMRHENENVVYQDEVAHIRDVIRGLLSLPTDAALVLGPSGTDLELLGLAITISSASAGCMNIVIGPDEVGSGTVLAAGGKAFAAKTASGYAVPVGGALPGFASHRIDVALVEIRDFEGRPRTAAEIHAEVDRRITEAANRGQRVLLHVVHRSKTGLVAPTWTSLCKVVAKWGDYIDVYVDACQGRISGPMIRDYLELGASICLTGSKFLGGPPFSGCLIVPQELVERTCSGRLLPSGLNYYLDPSSMCSGIDRGAMPGGINRNWGLILRWHAALYEAVRLNALGEQSVSVVVDAFEKRMSQVGIDGENLQPLDSVSKGGLVPERHQTLPLERDTLFSFLVRHPTRTKAMSYSEAWSVYECLNSRVRHNSISHPESMTVQVGQPVLIRSRSADAYRGVLRLLLSAPLIASLAPLTFESRRLRIDDIAESMLEALDFAVQMAQLGSAGDR